MTASPAPSPSPQRPVAGTIDWIAWLRRWDAQQTGYLPEREARFTAMLDAVGAVVTEPFVAVDLACGPGAISQRLLARFPGARCVAIDTDPVLLALGEGALGTVNGRLRWVKADLRDASWVDSLAETGVDAVLSATALHWLPGDALVRLYWQLGHLLRPGGVFLNADRLPFAPHLETFGHVAVVVTQQRQERIRQPEDEDWRQWWVALRREPSLAALFAERDQRLAWRQARQGGAPLWEQSIYDLHEAALREAGFREVGVIWQQFDNRVLMAVR